MLKPRGISEREVSASNHPCLQSLCMISDKNMQHNVQCPTRGTAVRGPVGRERGRRPPSSLSTVERTGDGKVGGDRADCDRVLSYTLSCFCTPSTCSQIYSLNMLTCLLASQSKWYMKLIFVVNCVQARFQQCQTVLY